MQGEKSTDPGPFNVGLLLFIPYRELEERVFAAVQDAGYTDITLPQARLFQRISAEGSRITELASRVYITKQTASVLVSSMERNGYVRRVPDPLDARASLVIADERGLAAGKVAAAEIQRIDREWRQALGSARYDRLLRDLQVLARLTNRPQ